MKLQPVHLVLLGLAGWFLLRASRVQASGTARVPNLSGRAIMSPDDPAGWGLF